MARLLFITIWCSLIFSVSTSSAQQACSQSPADCPDLTSIDNAKDCNICYTNHVSNKECIMQDSLRNYLTRLMNSIAHKEGWSVVEFSEIVGSGFSTQGSGIILADNLRPPHYYCIAFQFIVNNDSLQVWKTWQTNFRSNYLKTFSADSASTKQNVQNSSAATQSNVDSAQYYAKQLTDFLQNNAQQYQSAITSNNQAYLTKYNAQMQYYQNKINGVTNKVQTQQKADLAPMTEHQEQSDDAKYKALIKFGGACVLQVFFELNAYLGQGLPQMQSVSTSQPGVSLEAWFNNSKPDFLGTDWSFSKSTSMAELLFGDWKTQHNSYNGFPATNVISPLENGDIATVKKIPSTKVQTIAVHICGRKDKIQQFIQALNIQALSSLITNP